MIQIRSLRPADIEDYLLFTYGRVAGEWPRPDEARLRQEYFEVLTYPGSISAVAYRNNEATWLGVGTGALVPLEWGERLLSRPEPAVKHNFLPGTYNRTLLEKMLRTKHREYALVFMTLSFRPEMDWKSAMLARSKTMDAFMDRVHGYPLRLVIGQAYSASAQIDLARSGFCTAEPKHPGFPPYCYMRPEMAWHLKDNDMMRAFATPSPILGLTLIEQLTISAALDGCTDNEIASKMSVSPIAIRKRWLGIYDKVEAHLDSLSSGPKSESARGPERRRKALHLLRENPQEWKSLLGPGLEW